MRNPVKMNVLSMFGLFLIFSQGHSIHLSFPSFHDSLQWPRWDPFDEILAEPFLPGCRSQTTQCGHRDIVAVPALTKISQDERKVIVKLQVPSFKRDNIRIKSYINELRVSGERTCSGDERCNKKVFDQNVVLPHNVDFSTAKSYMSGDGWLIVKLSKTKPVERTVHIEENDEKEEDSSTPTPCEGCHDGLDDDEVTVEVDESSQQFCSQTSRSNDLYDIGV